MDKQLEPLWNDQHSSLLTPAARHDQMATVDIMSD
jgi:hypothetical protein